MFNDEFNRLATFIATYRRFSDNWRCRSDHDRRWDTITSCRGVAQPGRALGSGPRGRRFKSSRPDHFFRVNPWGTLTLPPEAKRARALEFWRGLADGWVEELVEGDAEAVTSFEGTFHRGPRLARVTHVAAENRPPAQTSDRFKTCT